MSLPFVVSGLRVQHNLNFLGADMTKQLLDVEPDLDASTPTNPIAIEVHEARAELKCNTPSVNYLVSRSSR